MKPENVVNDMTHTEAVGLMLAEGARQWRNTDAMLAHLLHLLVIVGMVLAPALVLHIYRAVL